MTASIAPSCFAYEVIPCPFLKPFIACGVDKYSGDLKPDHCLSDYLTVVDMAGGDMGNVIRYVPLCLTESTRRWLNGLLPA